MKRRTKIGTLTGLVLFSLASLYFGLMVLNYFIIFSLGRFWQYFGRLPVIVLAGVLLVAGLGVFCYHAYGELRRAAVWLPVASAAALFFAVLCAVVLSPLGAVLLFAAFACLVGAWVCTILDVRL